MNKDSVNYVCFDYKNHLLDKNEYSHQEGDFYIAIEK